MVVSLKSIIGACCGASLSRSQSFRTPARRGRNKKKPVDKISMLPDDVIHHILSFINIKYAIRTSVLSKRWKHIYKSLPYLNLDDVDGILNFYGYFWMIRNLIINRDPESKVSALSLRYDSKFDDLKLLYKSMVQDLLRYAIWHGASEISFYNCDFPHYLLKSKWLKRLSFTQSMGYIKCKTSDWRLSALISLHLEGAALGDEDDKVDLFSKFENLKDLKLIRCLIVNTREIEIFCPRLESLTLVKNSLRFSVGESCKFVVSTPMLLSFSYEDYPLMRVYMSVPCLMLNKVEIRASVSHGGGNKLSASEFMLWLHQFSSTKFLALGENVVVVLFVCLDLVKYQPSPFTQLRHLDIEKPPLIGIGGEDIADSVTNYFLASSPTATVNLINLIAKMM